MRSCPSCQIREAGEKDRHRARIRLPEERQVEFPLVRVAGKIGLLGMANDADNDRREMQRFTVLFFKAFRHSDVQSIHVIVIM